LSSSLPVIGCMALVCLHDRCAHYPKNETLSIQTFSDEAVCMSKWTYCWTAGIVFYRGISECNILPTVVRHCILDFVEIPPVVMVEVILRHSIFEHHVTGVKWWWFAVGFLKSARWLHMQSLSRNGASNSWYEMGVWTQQPMRRRVPQWSQCRALLMLVCLLALTETWFIYRRLISHG
jgi:hypothetical protein